MNIWKNLLAGKREANDNLAELLPLPEYALVEVKGPDAKTFLQGQCTCNLDDLSQKQWLLGAHCNPKGRMHSSFLVTQTSEDTLCLRLNKSILQHALASLSKYAVFSKVSLDPVTDHPIFALSGSEAILRKILNTLSVEAENFNSGIVYFFDQGRALVLENNLIEIWSNQEEIEDIFSKIAPYIYCLDVELSQSRWNLKMIQVGRAEVIEESLEKFLPYELNFQYINGISFKKGCYTGQEVIARLNYRAQLKKHMYRAKINLAPTNESLEQSQLIIPSGKKVGSVVLSAPLDQDHYEILALVNDDAKQSESVVLNIPSQPVLEWLPLPYAIT